MSTYRNAHLASERLARDVSGWESARRYAVATVLCAVFSAVYEYFSHGVISWWMVGLCGFPLMLGVVPALSCAVAGMRLRPLARQLWACGVMTLAMGSCLCGVLEIYGTTSLLVGPYLPAGLVLLGLGFVLQVVFCVSEARAA